MDFADYFPPWTRLTAAQQTLLRQSAAARSVKRGTRLHNGSADCLGLLLVRTGQLRACILSAEGREVTIYRLFDRDLCLFSASCMMRSIQFEIAVEAERDTELWVIPPAACKAILETSAPAANYINDIMSSRFSEVMWLVEQILWRRMDQRLAEFLLRESALEGTVCLSITHEKIAAHLGTAREVVTRMLRYFQSEGMVQLSRGKVTLTGRGPLESLAAE